jgi:hypothetical protein
MLRHFAARLRDWWRREPVDFDRLDGIGTPRRRA